MAIKGIRPGKLTRMAKELSEETKTAIRKKMAGKTPVSFNTESLDGMKTAGQFMQKGNISVTDLRNAQKVRYGEEVNYSTARAMGQRKEIFDEYAEVNAARVSGEITDKQAKKLGAQNAQSVTKRHIDNYYAKQMGKVSDDFTTTDYIGYHKIPQKAAAIGGTAWLVSRMADSKGQMSSSQLYGQQAPYSG